MTAQDTGQDSRDSHREKVISQLIETARKQFAAQFEEAGSLTQFADYLHAFYPISSPDDLMARDHESLVAIAYSMFKQSAKLTADKPVVKVINPRKRSDGWATEHTVVQIMSKDMPFLVDSITGALSVTLHYRIHMMHHPILSVARDAKGSRVMELLDAGDSSDVNRTAESVMYIELDAQSDKTVLKELKDTLTAVLADVHSVVSDFKAMLAKIDETVASLTVNPPPVPEAEVDEMIRYLRWLGDNHFTFLGFREYRYKGSGEAFTYELVDGSGLGILRDTERNVLRDVEGITPMSREVRHFLESDEPLIITKANVKATVHRNIHMDYVGIKIHNSEGVAIGERRLIGLFTSLSYSKFAHEVPVLRQKVQRIIARSPFQDNSYGDKTLRHVLEAFPRDELFQIPEDLLYETTMGVVQLMERPRPRAFLRRDKFERFVSALVYVPRDIYNSRMRSAIGRILCQAFNGEISVYHAQLSDNALARWHFIIRTTPGDVPTADEDRINFLIAEAAQGWTDRLLKVLVEKNGEEQGTKLFHTYRNRFSGAYKEAFTPPQAAYDISALERVDGKEALEVDFYRHLADGKSYYRLKIYHGSHMVALSDCMPILENMGFRVQDEHSFELTDMVGGFILDFRMEIRGVEDADVKALAPLIENLFVNVWNGVAEDDRFNQLAITASMTWRQVIILRAYGKYIRQLGLGYTPDYIADCVVRHPAIAASLIDIFATQFRPDLEIEDRESEAASKSAALVQDLEKIASLDDDRILRAYLNSMRATLRTNFYQDGVLDDGIDHQSPAEQEKVLAFKIRTQDLEEAPLPRPYAEMWVYSPRVEGVHLRFGPVARGGLRWSDRREDFRTEILGLVKAQQVKNAVIVPQGAKGGFYAKKLPAPSNREAFMAEGIASYRAFISSLLSLTDNLVSGDVVPPQKTLRRDGDDPYLVVAADKGTATFSDISNGLSEGHNFWLGDAFASGGSNGYDHKKMGITAKGAWVSVQRHLREMGINAQEDPFTVIGVGDMSGDVFGNGMLLSKTIRLKAAFNHLHIFIDPEPRDSEANWAERKRMFELPRSSWADYDEKLISKGGGIFSRAEKAIELTPEIKAWLGVSEDKLSPNALINAILKTEADLLWFGGIGTYVRDAMETDAQVGDRANDSLRVVAEDLRVKVIGEGGNLGMTQRSRIAFARAGGRLNTDFIDNSAGVDCSDKEVNIKILMAQLMQDGAFDRDARDATLVQMTDEVSDIVLNDNYLQSLAISLAEASASEDREYHLGLIRALERDGDLDREIEYLPSDENFAELKSSDQGLTRPEISTLMAYAKLSLKEILLRGNLIDSPHLTDEREFIFPTLLREKYANAIANHRLKREIVATVLANEVVNRAGLTFIYEVKEETGLAVEDIVTAFVIVRSVYNLEDRWSAINALDYKVAASVQYDMIASISDSMKAQVLWMLRNMEIPFDIAVMTNRFKAAMDSLFDIEQHVLSAPAQDAFVSRRDGFVAVGVPGELARFVAAFEVLKSGPDIVSVSEETGLSVSDTATIHFAIGDTLGFEWLRTRGERIAVTDHWDMLAVKSTIDDLADQLRLLVRDICLKGRGEKLDVCLADWRKAEQTRIIRAERLLDDLRGSGGFTVAKLSFAARHLRSILR